MAPSLVKFSVFLLAIVLICAQQEKKSGDCPPPVQIGICAITCRIDDHCNGITKCCRTSCGGSVCTRPVTARVPKLLAAKSGNCPEKPGGPWVCSSRCAFDGDCKGSKKCCRNRCGAMACQKPDAE